MRIFSFLLLLMVILFGITFATLNSESVVINYYFAKSTLPLSVLLVFTFAIGAILTMMVAFWLLLKAKIVNYRLQKRLNLADKEIENLRAIPLQDKV